MMAALTEAQGSVEQSESIIQRSHLQMPHVLGHDWR